MGDPKAELELKKLQADLQKVEADLKLDADRRADEVAKHPLEVKAMKRAGLASLGNLLSPWVAIVAVGLGVREYSDRQEQYFRQQESEYLGQVYPQLVNLAANLGDSGKHKRDEAIFLLAEYGPNAIPILVWSLARFKEPDAVVESLLRIRGSVHGEEIVTLLLESGRGFLEKASRDSVGAVVDPLHNHIIALQAFGDSKRQEVNAFLTDVVTWADARRGMAAATRLMIHEWVDTARNRIGGTQ